MYNTIYDYMSDMITTDSVVFSIYIFKYFTK